MRSRILIIVAIVLLMAAGWFLTGAPVGESDSSPKAAMEDQNTKGLQSERPNILIIVWDTVRSDRMSLYGHDFPTTPWLDQWASSARVFEQAVSPSFWTLPAHASLFTGTHVQTHGATWNYRWLDEEYTTIAEWLQDHGYATFAWSTNPNVHSLRNTHQGFSTFHSPFDEEEPWRERVLDATKQRLHAEDASTPISPRWKGKPKEAPMIAGAVAKRAITEWFDEGSAADRPFFAFINLMEVHDPRLPTEASRSGVFDSEVGYKKSLSLNASPGRMRKATTQQRPYTDAQRSVLTQVYDATLMDLDKSTQLLMDALEARGELENTIVLLTSDHGEAFGEHGYYRHNRGLHDEMIRVPLVLWYPERIRPARVERPVTTAAAFGALCSLANIEAPDTVGFISSGLSVEADSVVIADGREPVGKRNKEDPEDMWENQMAVYADGWKLIVGDAETQELYQIKSDPKEQNNAYGTHPEVVAKLTSMIDEWISSTPVRIPKDTNGPAPEDQEMEGLLKTLGYIE